MKLQIHLSSQVHLGRVQIWQQAHWTVIYCSKMDLLDTCGKKPDELYTVSFKVAGMMRLPCVTVCIWISMFGDAFLMPGENVIQ